ncbi:hypothetical protein TEQG_08287 [Trichophyton equinum CBS 127.97]|uniref:Uncharacterized protein n=1 Tax=Trichophyton equinum (strain ATCC MYA-4606 / CBS 127.97) TaxID=559882 RepID=F2Q5C1_TRIEC|nr:hypothetical protein TEQG_08287 [Trichophyton equinum CBS 127.97]
MAIDAGGEGSGLVKKRVRRTAERQLTKKNEDELTARDAMSESGDTEHSTTQHDTAHHSTAQKEQLFFTATLYRQQALASRYARPPPLRVLWYADSKGVSYHMQLYACINPRG